MPMLAVSVDAVIGVEAPTDTYTLGLVNQAGREMATLTIEATADGLRRVTGLGDAAGARTVLSGLSWLMRAVRSARLAPCSEVLTAVASEDSSTTTPAGPPSGRERHDEPTTRTTPRMEARDGRCGCSGGGRGPVTGRFER